MIEEFDYTSVYFPKYKRFGGARVKKTVKVFAAYLENVEKDIVLTEHYEYEWVAYEPPHTFGNSTIDPVLERIEPFLSL